MNQINRIKKYEHILNNSTQILNNLENALDALENNHKDLKCLSKYYGSKEWKQDFNDDRLGLIPQNINRGILSEDAIYNLLENNKEIINKMLEIANNMLKELK